MGVLRSQACCLVAVALCLVMTDTLMTQAQDYSAEELARRTLKRRAVEAVMRWSLAKSLLGREMRCDGVTH